MSEALEQNRADLENLSALGHAKLYERHQANIKREVLLKSQDATADELRPLFAERKTLIEQIQHVEGYEDFMRPPTFENDILPVLTPGASKLALTVKASLDPPVSPVLVYFSVTPQGGLALIVNADEIMPVWLDDLTENALREKVQGADGGKEWGGYMKAYFNQNKDRDAWFKAVDEIGSWLWDVCMGAVIKSLHADQTRKVFENLSCLQVTLIPQGMLGLLPLHAAWTDDIQEIQLFEKVELLNTKRLYALDLLNITYAPNARAIANAHKVAPTEADSLFIVDNPDKSLPYSSIEVQAILTHFTDKRQHLDDTSALHETVMATLAKYPVAHFSTHGWSQLNQPLQSGLLLANGQHITLRDILSLPLDSSQLAILSACETSVQGTKLGDEVVSLATGLVQAGVRGVVASLWSVSDLSTMMLMTRFYDLWKKEDVPPIDALRLAQIWLRDKTNGEKLHYFTESLDLEDKRFKPLKRYFKTRTHSLDEAEHVHPFHWAAFGYHGI